MPSVTSILNVTEVFLYNGLGIFLKFEYKNYIWNSFLEGE